MGRKWLGGCLVLAVLAGPGCAGLQMGSAPREDLGSRITEAQHFWRSSGASFWGEALPHHPSQATSPEMKLQILLDRLVYVSPLRGYDIRARIMPDRQINASTDGNTIQVNAGLLSALGSSEDLVASVLAHELSHIIANHKKSAAAKSDLLLQVLGPALGFSKYGAYAGLALNEMNRMRSASYSRTDEMEADAMATLLVMEAGYQPQGLTEFLQAAQPGVSMSALTQSIPPVSALQDPAALSQGAALFLLRASPLYKTHPPSGDRQRVVQLISARKSGIISGAQLQQEDPWLEGIYRTVVSRSPKNRGGPG